MAKLCKCIDKGEKHLVSTTVECITFTIFRDYLEMLDFSTIRGGSVESKRAFFEQLFCHLAKLDQDSGSFRRIDGSGGDGGVEAVRILASGREIGYQSKYHTSRDDIAWTKLDNSVHTALKHHPHLERYVVAIPCHFTGTRTVKGGGTSDGTWGDWSERVKSWTDYAAQLGINVDFDVWTAFELEEALLQPNAQHLWHYFFGNRFFTRHWLCTWLDRTIVDLGARYSAAEHIDTQSLKPFDLIYRRANVRNELLSLFDTAEASDPRAAVRSSETTLNVDESVRAVEQLQSKFISLRSAVDSDLSISWPVCSWFTSWYAFTGALADLCNLIRSMVSDETTADYDRIIRKIEDTTRIFALRGPEVFGGSWAHLLPIDGCRAALFVGRAGAGKSHLLARATEVAFVDSAPIIHLLGEYFVAGDPRALILNHLELRDWPFGAFLTALNLAAEAAKTRAMLVIDALNEGYSIELWRSHLAGFIHEVNKHDRIVLVVSCREEYLDFVVPDDLIAKPQVYPGEDGVSPQIVRRSAR